MADPPDDAHQPDAQQPGDEHHDDPPSKNPPRLTLPNDPDRWERGDWAFDPKEDAEWENPEILRRRIGTPEELEAVADAVVRGYPIELNYWDAEHGTGERVYRSIVNPDGELSRYALIENLRELVDAVQTHPDVRLAHADLMEDSDGIVRALRRWVADHTGQEIKSPTRPTVVRVVESVVEQANFKGLDIRVELLASARFAKDAIFGYARFAEEASFSKASFSGNASFYSTRFAAEATFTKSCFAGEVSFRDARFADNVSFHGARFDGATYFEETRFTKVASFRTVRVSNALTLSHCRFERAVDLSCATFTGIDGVVSSRRSGLYLTGSELQERLVLKEASFFRRARLGLNRLILVGGATIEMDYEQLRPEKRARRVVEERFKRPARGGWARAAFNVLSWFGFVKRPAFIAGEDSDDPQQLRVAAEDYELLAVNFKKLAATDWHEDWCRWRAKELARRADLLDAGSRAMGPVAMREGWLREIVEPWVVVGRSAWFVMHEVCWRWLIERTVIGYLLYVHRLIVWGVGLMFLCGLAYAAFASPETISFNGALPAGVEAGSPEAGSYAMEMWSQGSGWHSLLSGLYFSLTTFVTLGYGDFAPLGWFKLVTGIEALLGVTLVALFTVAWGRKLVR